ncbi:MAG TPA: hypothetical protein PKA77_07705 [Chitinophagaceae bacterium]|jgi:hypothetical protein|nr:hypothetical protein [Chitinophagaceae bacterium]HMU57266.1 hypothetical protein [Chitinophagaceae bacterium]
MKKIAMGIAAFLLIVTASAFTYLAAGTAKPTSGELYWFTTSMSYDGFQSHEDEVSESGCPDDGSLVCRKGYREDQLINPANPSLGVKSAEVNSPDDIIYRTQ